VLDPAAGGEGGGERVLSCFAPAPVVAPAVGPRDGGSSGLGGCEDEGELDEEEEEVEEAMEKERPRRRCCCFCCCCCWRWLLWPWLF